MPPTTILSLPEYSTNTARTPKNMLRIARAVVNFFTVTFTLGLLMSIYRMATVP